MDAIGNEMERSSAFHDDRLAIISPPTFPIVVGPFSARRAEHVPAKDERAKAVHRTTSERLVDVLRATALSHHRFEGLRSEEPCVEFRSALS